MGIRYWQDESDDVFIAKSMQAIAINAELWAAYISCGQKGRAIFQQCAADDLDWSLDTVLAYAAYEDPAPTTPAPTTPAPVTPPPTAARTAPAQVRVPERGREEDTNVDKFIAWMSLVSAATAQDKSLAYACGERRVLKGDGTVAVSVSVHRGGRFLSRVSFVFHYHPGSSGAGVGSAEGSKWHFKPFDGAKKWVRLADYQFGKLDQAMVKRVKDIARKR